MGAVQPVGARGLRGLDDRDVLYLDLALAVLDRLPQRIVDDAEFGNLRNDPLLGRIDPGHPLAGLRVLDIALPVPHQPADVELVVDEAGATFGVAPDGGIGPQPTGRAGDAFPVQPPGDGPRVDPVGELAEDAPDNFRFRLIDGPVRPPRTGSPEPSNDLTTSWP